SPPAAAAPGPVSSQSPAMVPAVAFGFRPAGPSRWLAPGGGEVRAENGRTVISNDLWEKVRTGYPDLARTDAGLVQALVRDGIRGKLLLPGGEPIGGGVVAIEPPSWPDSPAMAYVVRGGRAYEKPVPVLEDPAVEWKPSDVKPDMIEAPAPEQVAVAEQLARAILPLENISPDVLRTANEAVAALASVPAETDPDIAEAIQAVSTPEFWS